MLSLRVWHTGVCDAPHVHLLVLIQVHLGVPQGCQAPVYACRPLHPQSRRLRNEALHTSVPGPFVSQALLVKPAQPCSLVTISLSEKFSEQQNGHEHGEPCTLASPGR